MTQELAEFYRGKRVLVTGGLGFIGSNLARSLVQHGAEVMLLDSMIPEYGGSLIHLDDIRTRVDVNFSDMRDPHSLRYLVEGKEIIFNLAGQVSHIDSMRDPMNDLDINCRSQLTLLECCRKQNPRARIVFTGTRQVYGKPRYLPVDEQHPLDPADVNGINKLAAEMYFQLYSRVYGMHCVCLRLTNTYGPRMDLRNATKGFVGVFLQRALSGQSIQVFGTGQQKRDFNYVEDVIQALLLAGQRDEVIGGCFNLGGPVQYTILEFLQTLRQQVDFEWCCQPFPQERQAIDIGDYWGDFSRFRVLTGWEPRVDLGEGLARTVNYFVRNPELWCEAVERTSTESGIARSQENLHSQVPQE